jgi:hypothetical protein
MLTKHGFKDKSYLTSGDKPIEENKIVLTGFKDGAESK